MRARLGRTARSQAHTTASTLIDELTPDVSRPGNDEMGWRKGDRNGPNRTTGAASLEGSGRENHAARRPRLVREQAALREDSRARAAHGAINLRPTVRCSEAPRATAPL